VGEETAPAVTPPAEPASADGGEKGPVPGAP
jgi:hypothetical protein